ncbi:MAG: flagellar biosynthesis protein FlhA [Janthinobacterium lividum]
MNAAQRLFHRHGDIAMVLLVLGILMVLFVPIPGALLDFLILANFGFAFLILLLTFYMARPVEFSTFPSLLLVATLFRLALNVAATRLILSQASAGQVIAAIGSYVVGGNYVIGLIVFLILIVVQYVVVTNGAQRVSEVAARFTLDSMPGQQMSIDADLNMGFIDQAQAQQRRRNIEKEAGFYGAMDGASKFVKGDAIAGIIILLINILGGIVIGVMQHHMPWAQALQTYTLLTIGDGIVTQVPALVIAVGTGIIVTRSASDANLSHEVLRQITSFPKTLLLVGAALGALLLMPGMPWLPATVLMLAAAMAGWLVWRRSMSRPGHGKSSASGSGQDGPESGAATAWPAGQNGPDGQSAVLPPAVLPIEIHVGANWVPLVAEDMGPVMARVAQFRQAYAQDCGFVLPPVRVQDAARLSANKYEIHLDGSLAARGEVRTDRWLAIHPAGDQRSIAGEPTRDPTYGLPALWIEEHQREAAVAARYTVVDASSVFMTHLCEVLRRESAILLTRAETERMLMRLRQSQPGLVEELVPTILSVGDIQKVLQSLLREKVSIRHLEAILETLIDAGRHSRDMASLVEAVRRRLGQAICQSLLGDSATALQVITLDPAIESRLLHDLAAAQDLAGHASSNAAMAAASNSAQERFGQQGMPPEAGLAEQCMLNLAQMAERMMKHNLLPVLLCAPELRRHLRALSERLMPHLRVLSMAEVPNSVELKSFGVVSV